MEHVNNNLARLTTSAPGMGWISTRRPAAAGADRTRQARGQLSPTSLFMGLPRKRESSPVMGRVHPATGEAPADTTPHIRGVRSPEAGRLRPIEWAITPHSRGGLRTEILIYQYVTIRQAGPCMYCLSKKKTHNKAAEATAKAQHGTVDWTTPWQHPAGTSKQSTEVPIGVLCFNATTFVGIHLLILRSDRGPKRNPV